MPLGPFGLEVQVSKEIPARVALVKVVEAAAGGKGRRMKAVFLLQKVAVLSQGDGRRVIELCLGIGRVLQGRKPPQEAVPVIPGLLEGQAGVCGIPAQRTGASRARVPAQGRRRHDKHELP